MSASDQMRAMLDELMGTARDGRRSRIEFDDYRVCKCSLLGCCPHDILAGTRMDIGECESLHDPALKADYNIARRKKDYNFEKETYRTLERFISNIDKKIAIAIKNLKETQDELSEEAGEIAEEIHKFAEQIGTKLAEAEMMGADGRVQESLLLTSQIDDLNRQKSLAEIRLRNSLPATQYQQQKLRVCEVCSAYLGISDNDRRLADHFGGKLHLGFIELRQRLIELKKHLDRKAGRNKNSSSISDKQRERSRSKEKVRLNKKAEFVRSDRNTFSFND